MPLNLIFFHTQNEILIILEIGISSFGLPFSRNYPFQSLIQYQDHSKVALAQRHDSHTPLQSHSLRCASSAWSTCGSVAATLNKIMMFKMGKKTLLSWNVPPSIISTGSLQLRPMRPSEPLLEDTVRRDRTLHSEMWDFPFVCRIFFFLITHFDSQLTVLEELPWERHL